MEIGFALYDLWLGNDTRLAVIAYDDMEPLRSVCFAEHRGEFLEVGRDRFKGGVCFNPMHVNHPDISRLISDEVSPSESHPDRE